MTWKRKSEKYLRLRIFMATLLLSHIDGETVQEKPERLEMPEDLLQTKDVPRNKIDEGVDMEDLWVHYAILDLAYYIRSHKFNEYDRRYFEFSLFSLRFMRNAKTAPKVFYKKFPEPPLRTFQWEVHKHCSLGFIDCLKYAFDIINVAMLQKDSDPAYIIRKKKWTWAKNKKDIERANRDCKRMFKEDFEEPVPFVGPIHRFQWRTTVSYYMCLFTLQEHPELSVFGEPCDNYASCLMKGDTVSTKDPRADDKIPFNCARYSFCPDPCCPLKNISSLEECVADPSNPCPADSVNRTCSIEMSKNLDIFAFSKNHWNLSCHCDERGVRWESRFGLCVDINECEEGNHNCSDVETCLNLRGSYACGCSFGYLWHNHTRNCRPLEQIMNEISAANLVLRPNKTELKKRKSVKNRFKKLFFWQKTGTETLSSKSSLQSINKSITLLLTAFCFISLVIN